MSYLETAREIYKKAAETPQALLCCVAQPKRCLPGLVIPEEMSEMNYGCGTTVHFGDIAPSDTILYVGVGGGLEALQFAYFTRRAFSVIAVDAVPEMLEKEGEISLSPKAAIAGSIPGSWNCAKATRFRSRLTTTAWISRHKTVFSIFSRERIWHGLLWKCTAF